jgi:predicted Zn-dependent protease
MISDPSDPDGGYQPFFGSGFASPKMSWIEGGTLKNLAYSVGYAMARGKPYAENPWSIRVTGGNTTIEQMIAQCQEGVYVNRFSSVDLVDMSTGMMTGVTRDGCFFVKNGKIDRPIKNFRFLESPFVFMNNVEAMGVPERAAFGYTPPAVTYYDPFSTWPRRPVIVPPMMVRDFNFSALSDAV